MDGEEAETDNGIAEERENKPLFFELDFILFGN